MNYSPYAPPAHPQEPYRGGGYSQFAYSPLGWRTTAAIVCMMGTVVLTFAQTGATLAFGDVMRHPTPENLGPILVLGVIGLGTSVLAIGGYVFFLMWMYQAAKNVRAFGQDGLEYTPGWCVGWWFIPIASLFKPLGAMKEIWRASDPDAVGPRARYDWRSAPVPSIMTLWWVIYVLNGFIAIGIVLASLDFSGGGPKVAVGPASFITHTVLGVAGVLLVVIMRRLVQRQSASAARLAEASSQGGGYGDGAVSAGANPYAAPVAAPNPYMPQG